MSRLRRRVLARGTQFLDILVMLVSLGLSLFLFSYDVRYYDPLYFFSLKVKVINFIIFAILAFVYVGIFNFLGLYDQRQLRTRLREWLDIFKAVSLSTIFLAAVSLIGKRGNVNQLVLFSFWVICTLLTIVSRVLLQDLLIYLRNKGRNLRHIVIVGSGPRALELAKKLISNRDFGYKLLGFIDDNFEISGSRAISRAKRLCTLKEFDFFIENNVVDEVFTALPIKSYYQQIHRIARICEEQGITVRVPSDWFSLKTARSSAFELDGIPIVSISTGNYAQARFIWMKRLMDIVISIIFLGLFSPVLVVVAALIKLTSPGPIFFKQERVGYYKRIFKVLKFRTMVHNAEKLQSNYEHMNELQGPVFKIKNDPRITRIGKFLRKTSLDEIPQLINVLKGEMSIVGPRPLPIRDVNGFESRWHKRRFSVRPGLTCLWQVNGRNRIGFEDWMKLDLQYIDHWSLGLDLKILAKTVPAVIKGDGAS